MKWQQYKEHDKRPQFLLDSLLNYNINQNEQFFWQVLSFLSLANVKIELSVL